MRRISFAWSLLVILPTVFAACGDDGDNEGGAGGGDDEGTGNGGPKTSSNAGGAGGGGDVLCQMPQDVPCEDAVILGMNLQDDITDGEITNVPDGTGWRTASSSPTRNDSCLALKPPTCRFALRCTQAVDFNSTTNGPIEPFEKSVNLPVSATSSQRRK